MSVAASSVRIFPFSVTRCRLNWLNWRLRRLGRLCDPLHLRLETIHQERKELNKQCSLENPTKHDQLTKLKEEQSRLERKLEPFDQAYDAICRSQARYLATHNK